MSSRGAIITVMVATLPAAAIWLAHRSGPVDPTMQPSTNPIQSRPLATTHARGLSRSDASPFPSKGIGTPSPTTKSRSAFERDVMARAQKMVDLTGSAADADRWIQETSETLDDARMQELVGLATDTTLDFEARFLSEMLIAGARGSGRVAALVNLASRPMPALSLASGENDRARARERILRKVAIDSLALDASAQTIRALARTEADPRLRAYAWRVSRLIGKNQFAERRILEDEAIARIASGSAQ